jgi:hypothetical protein
MVNPVCAWSWAENSSIDPGGTPASPLSSSASALSHSLSIDSPPPVNPNASMVVSGSVSTSLAGSVELPPRLRKSASPATTSSSASDCARTAPEIEPSSSMPAASRTSPISGLSCSASVATASMSAQNDIRPSPSSASMSAE